MFYVKLEGHIRYFGVSFNNRKVNVFVNKAVRILFKWMNRRTQWERGRFIPSFLSFFASLRGFFDAPGELWQKYVLLIR